MTYFQFSFSSMLYVCLLLTWSIFAISCRQTPSDGGPSVSSATPGQVNEQPTDVEVVTVEKVPFSQELIANGRLSAVRKADLRFRMEGIIERLHVIGGSRVEAGQLIATLNDDVQQQALQYALLRQQQATMDYEDQLLRLGFRAADTAKLDEEVKRVARLRSGLSNALLDWQKAENDIRHTQLSAPFSGKIANVKAKAFNSTAGFEYVCSLIDDREFDVEFSVLEQEIDFVTHAGSVRVIAFSEGDQAYEGKITSVNPQVDKSGMVTVHAVIRNQGGGLMDGMSVNVTISRSLGEQLVVPKEAVLDRQGRKVVFTATDEGTAYWNYVKVGPENSTHYAIEDGLSLGDQVIYSGNFNLAHEKPIRVQRGNR